MFRNIVRRNSRIFSTPPVRSSVLKILRSRAPPETGNRATIISFVRAHTLCDTLCTRYRRVTWYHTRRGVYRNSVHMFGPSSRKSPTLRRLFRDVSFFHTHTREFREFFRRRRSRRGSRRTRRNKRFPRRHLTVRLPRPRDNNIYLEHTSTYRLRGKRNKRYP